MTRTAADALVRQVLRTIQTNAMIRGGDHVVAAVSGGADSVALLHVLLCLRARLDVTITVAHLDHMIRGAAARREAGFVADMARRLGLACVVERRDVPAWQRARGVSLQQAARDVRYTFLEEVAQRENAARIALGHTAEDQAETVLLWLVRGAALDGLCGMPPVRGAIVRPLIEVRRRQIERYLSGQGIDFVADTSAGELHYRRNRVRHHLLPLLEREFNPAIVETLGRTARILRQDREMLDGLAVGYVPAGPESLRDGKIEFPVESIMAAPPLLRPRVVRALLGRACGGVHGLTERHVRAVLGLLKARGSSCRVALPGTWQVWREYDRLCLTQGAAAPEGFQYCCAAVPEVLDVPEAGVRLTFRVRELAPADRPWEGAPPETAFFDARAVAQPIVVRSWCPGDRFQPLGMQGMQKIQDFFCDRKVPARQRHRVPLLLFGHRLAWVCGMRVDERCRVLPDAATVLEVRLAPLPAAG